MELTETGKTVYDRTYSRPKPDGTKETWPETVERVVDGNLALAGKHDDDERERLIELITEFKIIPAGRHLWASGVKNAPHLFNCWVAPWGEDPWEHFAFTFLRLMEGGGVGANYSNKYLWNYHIVQGFGIGVDGFEVHIVCDPEHPDYQKMLDAGVLSTEYTHEWAGGAFEVEDSREGWADALVDLLQVYYRDTVNKCRVFDVSRVRPEGARLKTFGGRASGPLPLARMLSEVAEVMNTRIGRLLDGISAMEIDHAIAKCVVSGGNRRSARMAMMHWNDHQIFDFMSAKRDSGKHWTTNISVEVDDEFWQRAASSGYFAEDEHARTVLYHIAAGMLANGEPGFWNSSYSNAGEPNPVICTNPCGEIPLEPYEPCNLGHVNLAAFVDEFDGKPDVIGLYEAHRLITRFLIRATFAEVNDPNSREVLNRNRRIGVGHLGVASYLALTGTKYSEAPSNYLFNTMLESMSSAVDRHAQQYAHDLRIPVPVKTRTVAPTGTIAKMPGVSEGLHPIFARYFIRRIRFSDVDPDQRAQVEDYRARGFHTAPCLYAPETTVVEIPTMDPLVAAVEAIYPAQGEWSAADSIVESADEIELEDMLRFQAMYQELWADNAVSYTINVDPKKYNVPRLIEALTEYGPQVKGATVFPESSMAQSPYERLTREQYHKSAAVEVADGVDELCASGACPVR